ncbi:hypothetical protein B0T18DRAFT_459801, partial [Schizothecium vesticola]
MFSFAGAGDQRASPQSATAMFRRPGTLLLISDGIFLSTGFCFVGIHMQTLTQPQTQHGCTLQSIDYRGRLRDEQQTPDFGDDEPLGTPSSQPQSSPLDPLPLPLPELRGCRSGGWNPCPSHHQLPASRLTTLDDDGARPGGFGLPFFTSKLPARACWLAGDSTAAKRPQARQAVHKMRAGAVPLRCVRRRLSGRLSCCARQTMPAVSQASSRPLARGRGMWSWRRRVSRPATLLSRQQHLCNVRGAVPPFHAQESSRLGL